MKISNIIEIKTIIDNLVDSLNKSSKKGITAIEIIKTDIYVDYIDSETNEESRDFHPNMYYLYTDSERKEIKTLIDNIESFINKYAEIKKAIPSLFNPIERLENK